MDDRFHRGSAKSRIELYRRLHEDTCVTQPRRTRPSSKRSRRANGSSRSITCCSPAARRASAGCWRLLADHARRSGVKHPVHRQHPLHQHHPRSRTAAVSRQPRNRAPHQEPRPLERAGDGRQGQQAGRGHRRTHLDVSRRPPRSTRSGFNHFFKGKGDDHDGDIIYFQGHAAPGIYARAFLEGRIGVEQLENFRRELKPGGGLSSYPHPVADARLLGVPDGVDGARADLRDLPGALHALPRGSRAEETVRLEGLGVPRRRRDRRTRIARRHHARLPRKARQPDLRHQLQPPAARRPGPRQRPDHPGARGDLPRRRLERPQGHLGQRVGCAAREGPRRPARQADGRGRRRRVSEVRRRIGRLRPAAFLGRRPAAARDGQAPVGRAAEEADARRTRSDQGLRGVQGRRRAHRTADRHPRPHDQGLRHRRSGRGQEHHPPAEEAQRRRAARVPHPLRRSDWRRRSRQGAVLPSARQQPRDHLHPRAAQAARRVRSQARRAGRAAQDRLAAGALRRVPQGQRRAARRRRRWRSCGCWRSC